jgi:hypothetical protein
VSTESIAFGRNAKEGDFEALEKLDETIQQKEDVFNPAAHTGEVVGVDGGVGTVAANKFDWNGRVRKSDGLFDGWPDTPEGVKHCSTNGAVPEPTRERPAPGYFSKRVLLFLSGESFRGARGVNQLMLNHDIQESRCSAHAAEIQKAEAKAQLANLVAPLVQAGFDVDIALFSYTCAGTDASLDAALSDYYNQGAPGLPAAARVVLANFSKPLPMMGDGITAAANVMADALSRSKSGYASVIWWRFDIVPMRKLNVGEATSLPIALDRKTKFEHEPGYAVWGRETVAIHDDQVFFFPGWAASCFLSPTINREQWLEEFPGQLLENGRSIPQIKSSFKGLGATFFQGAPERMPEMLKPVIYRGSMTNCFWSGGSMKTCYFLRDKFDGPPCSALHQVKTACQAECKSSDPKRGEQCLQAFWGSYIFYLETAHQPDWDDKSIDEQGVTAGMRIPDTSKALFTCKGLFGGGDS